MWRLLVCFGVKTIFIYHRLQSFRVHFHLQWPLVSCPECFRRKDFLICREHFWYLFRTHARHSQIPDYNFPISCFRCSKMTFYFAHKQWTFSFDRKSHTLYIMLCYCHRSWTKTVLLSKKCATFFKPLISPLILCFDLQSSPASFRTALFDFELNLRKSRWSNLSDIFSNEKIRQK